MCRFLICMNTFPEILYDYVFNYEHSIIKQSFQKAYTPYLRKPNLNCDINMDGFGLGWINEYSNEFNYYKNNIPIRNDINLKEILKNIRTKLAFIHIRANTLNLLAPIFQ